MGKGELIGLAGTAVLLVTAAAHADSCGVVGRLWRQGLSTVEIARASGLAPSAVAACRRRRREGVPVQTQARRPRPAGPAPLRAAGPPPLRAAGPPPAGAAGPPPGAAAGPPPLGAAGPPPSNAAGFPGGIR